MKEINKKNEIFFELEEYIKNKYNYKLRFVLNGDEQSQFKIYTSEGKKIIGLYIYTDNIGCCVFGELFNGNIASTQDYKDSIDKYLLERV